MSNDTTTPTRRRLCSGRRCGALAAVTAAALVAGVLVLVLPARLQAQDPLEEGVAFRVSGIQLQDRAGDRVILTGATHYLIPFYPSSTGGVDPALEEYTNRSFAIKDKAFAEMKRLGMNTVRVPVSLTGWVDDPYGIGGKDAYMRRLEAIIDSAIGNDLYVVIVWFGGRVQPGTAAYDAFAEMSERVAELAKDRPEVIIEPINEPVEEASPEWVSQTELLLQLWREDLGYRGLMIIDTPYWSWSFDPDAATEVLERDSDLLGESRVLFANHRYANFSDSFVEEDMEAWDDEILTNVRLFPILGGEYGWYTVGFPTSFEWNTEFFQHLAAVAIPEGMNGAMAFAWHWVDDNSMTTDDGLTINHRGKQYVDLVVEPVNEL